MSSARSYASAVSGAQSDKPALNTGHSGQKTNSKSTRHTGRDQPAQTRSPRPPHQSTATSEPSRSRSRSRSSTPSGPYTASEYTRYPDHIPRTTSPSDSASLSSSPSSEQVYILTLHLSTPLHKSMTALRKTYFPAHLNKLDAHITLFHALPHSHLLKVTHDISTLCTHQAPIPIAAESPYSPSLRTILVKATSRGYAVEGVQKRLREQWGGFLSAQDARPLRPHWTILNKVPDREEVKAKFEEVKAGFERVEGMVQGLVLWRYERGWWRDPRVFEFEGVGE